jgi:glycerate 2-kinase
MTNFSELLRGFFTEAIRKVDVAAAVESEIWCAGTNFSLGELYCDVKDVRRLLVIAVGKAASAMYEGAVRGIERCLDAGVRVEAIVVGPVSPEPRENMIFCPGSHPIPDEMSRWAAEIVMARLQSVDERTAVLFLVSGGASSMMEQPLDPAISVEDMAEFYRCLVVSGLPIREMNVVRKHFSAVKGGRLAERAGRAAAICTLIVSDVPDGSLSSVGSGPSVPDDSTTTDCLSILNRLMERAVLPETVVRFFGGPLFVETPRPNDAAFQRSYAKAILSSEDLAAAVARMASRAGFHVEIDNTCDEWDYRDAGLYLLERSRDLGSRYPSFCLISVGEVAVAMEGPGGRGGRNQHFALWCAGELARRGDHIAMLSAGSDGIDGNSPAAGAIADATTWGRARRAGFDGEQCLREYDSYTLFQALGDAVVTGPTANNLRDLRIFIGVQGG